MTVSSRGFGGRLPQVYRLLLLLAVISCAPGDDGGRTEVQRLRFHIDWAPGIDYAGYFVAEEVGKYSDRGLDVNIVPGNGAEQAATMVEAGEVDLGTSTVDAILRLYYARPGVKDLPKILAIIFPKNPVVLVSPSSRPLETLDQLATSQEVVIGFSEETSVTYQQFNWLLRTDPRLRSQPPTLKKVGWDGARQLMKGEVDGVLGYATDVPVQLQLKGFHHRVTPLENLGVTVAGQCIVASSDFLRSDANRAVAKKFVEASVEGWKMLRDDREESLRAFRRVLPEVSDRELRIGLDNTVDLLPALARGTEGYVGNALVQSLERSHAVLREEYGEGVELDPSSVIGDVNL